MKIIVTGSAGFIGSHLSEFLLKEGHEVIGIDNLDEYYDIKIKHDNLDILSSYSNFTFHKIDIRDRDAIFHIFLKNSPDRVVHLAAKAGVRYSLGRSLLYTDVNISGTINILDASCESDCKGFIFASTSSIYGSSEKIPFKETEKCNQPLAPYPATKAACELLGYSYHNNYNLKFTALRFFSVYGPRGRPDMMPYMVIDSIYNKNQIKLFGEGKLQRDWTYVDDIISGIYSSVMVNSDFEIINLGKGSPQYMIDFVEIIEKLAGQKAIRENTRIPKTEPMITFADISHAKSILNYHPVTNLETGLIKTLDWYKSSHNLS